MPPTVEPAAESIEQEEVRHAATARRRARQAAELEEARRKYRLWRDVNAWLIGTPALAAALTGLGLLISGRGLVPTIAAVASGMVAAVLGYAAGWMLLEGGPLEPFSDNFLVAASSLVASPVLAAVAGTLAFAWLTG